VPSYTVVDAGVRRRVNTRVAGPLTVAHFFALAVVVLGLLILAAGRTPEQRPQA